MPNDEIIAMAVAAIAEELGTDVKKVRVVSFKEADEAQEESKWASIYRIKMNGKTYEMEIDLIEEGKPKKTQPAPITSNPVVKEPVTMEEPAETNPSAIKAPMSGNIIQVMVNAGDEVKENDVILILEAMKMENEVCAPRAGKIKSIFVTEGQAVSADAPLFEMED